MSCARAIVAPVFIGRDNVMTLVLSADGVVLDDLSAVTRVIVDMDGGVTVIDSDSAGSGVIWWSDTVTYRGASINVLRLQLGDQGIPAGTYEDVAITVYDATYALGLHLETQLNITVNQTTVYV